MLVTDISTRRGESVLLVYECGEPLVSLTNISPKIKVYPYYYLHRVQGAFQDCYLREGAAQKLRHAAEQLPEGIHLVVLDGWRPYEVQLALYEMTKAILLKNGEVTEKNITRELEKFVAYPSDDPEAPSRHMTGGAVDLTLADDQGWLDMGTDFDEFTDKAKTDWYDDRSNLSANEIIVRNNRTLLKQMMVNVGFRNYEEEWWHYDYGNQPWAALTNEIAFYKGIKLPKNVLSRS